MIKKLQNLSLDFFDKYLDKIRVVFLIVLFMAQLGLVFYFINFGYEFSSSSYYGDFRTVIYGILLSIIIIIGFFIANFSGGFDFNPKWILLPVGLAVGGSIAGIGLGSQYGSWGWVVGFFIGLGVIALTYKIVWPFKQSRLG